MISGGLRPGFLYEQFDYRGTTRFARLQFYSSPCNDTDIASPKLHRALVQYWAAQLHHVWRPGAGVIFGRHHRGCRAAVGLQDVPPKASPWCAARGVSYSEVVKIKTAANSAEEGRAMLLGKNFDDIDAATMQALIEAGASESVHLDFKRDSYGNADADKKELLKDITAFANALGGHLIIGMDEEDGAASALTLLAGIDVDQELLRLESITRTGVEPTIIGLRMKRIDVEGGSIILIHVPRSFNPPHRVIFKNTNRYYARNSAGVHELSLEELRMLFGEQRSIEERAKAFIGGRFLRIQGNDGAMPIPVSDGVLVMHLVPLSDFGAARRNDISDLLAQHQLFRPIGSTGFSSRVNLEGYCVYRGGDICHGYTQIFRDGSLEATTASMFRIREGQRYFPSLALPERLIEAIKHYMKGLRAIEASPPILLQISAMNVQGIRMGVDRAQFWDEPPPYERDELHLPPTVITEYREDDNYESVIAEQMDFLWNAFNFDRCFYFDEEGKWVGK